MLCVVVLDLCRQRVSIGRVERGVQNRGAAEAHALGGLLEDRLARDVLASPELNTGTDAGADCSANRRAADGCDHSGPA